MIKKIKLNLKSKNFLLFLKHIDESFKDNKHTKNSPWKYYNLNNFNFYFYFFKKKILGSIVTSKHQNNIHINFLYVLKDKRSRNIGTQLLDYINKKKTLVMQLIFQKNYKKKQV